MYIYLTEQDDFSKIPPEIMRAIGITEFTMELELNADTRLARENASDVMKNLDDKGFHLLLPSETTVESIMTRLAKGK